MSAGLVTGVAGGSTVITASESLDGQGVHAVGCGGCPGPQNMMATATANVQVPGRLVPYDYPPCAPSGVGALQTITNGSVVDCGGKTRATNFCGVNRNLVYQLLDSSGTQAFVEAYSLQESFSNFSTTNSQITQPKATSASIPAGGLVTDAQFVGFTYPSCLGTNDHASYTQNFTVTAGGRSYPLTTTVSISLGRFNGTYEDNVTITTP